MTTRKRTPGGIPASALAANITAGATSLTLTTGDGANWPTTFPYDIIINRASATSRERITVGGKTSDTLNTLTRGIDGTSGQAHNLGDSVEVCVAGSFLDELGQLLGGSAGNIYYYDGTALQKLTTGNARQRLISGTTPAWSYTSIPTYANAAARDAEIAAPAAGMAAYLDTGDSLEGLYFYNGTNWRPVSWNAPWGVVASASSTSDQTGITTLADITFASAGWTAVSNRLYRATLTIICTQVTTAGIQSIEIQTGSSGAGTLLARNPSNSATVTATTAPGYSVSAFQTGSGAISVHARGSTSAGTLTIANSSLAKGWLVVEDVGPTGNPV